MDNMIYGKLATFLQKFPKTENKKHTHTIYGGQHGGSYTIPKENLDEFYGLVTKALFRNQNDLSLVEKLQPICPLVIDLDFKYKNEITERQYNKGFINDMITKIFETVNELYVVEESKQVCWVMEKNNYLPAPQKNYTSKDGLHFLFPYIVAEKSTYLTLREELLNLNINELFTKNNCTPPSNDIEEIIDEKIYKGGNWFIYGSGKPNEIKYKLTTILKYSNNILTELPIHLYIKNPVEIVKMNSVSKYSEVNVGYNECLDNKLKQKPLKNSMSVDSIETMVDYNNPETLLTKTQKYDLDIAKHLVDCLSVERASDCKTWIDVGYCLHSINPRTMLPYWISFSKKWPMYMNDDECKKQWEYMDKSNNREYKIGTLYYWAKQDNFEAYKNVLKESLEGLIKISIKGDKTTGAHADVANVVYHYFKNCFRCAGLKDRNWYYWNELMGGKWEVTEQGHILRKRLSGEIVDLYTYWQGKYQNQLSPLDEEDELYQILNNRVKNICKVIIKLKDSSYKDNIMKECKELFYDKDFTENLNDKKHIIGFENGVYDLDKSVFREGLPEDYISLSCGLIIPVTKDRLPMKVDDIIHESKHINEYTELNHGLNDFLTKVFPIPKVKEYILRFLSGCLSGEIREEKFRFWTGKGGNGKSKLVELIDFAFGDYSRSMDVAYLTTKRGSSSAASPELESVKHARFVSMSEPEKTDEIYVGKLKQMTGGDKMTTRGLFKETSQFKPQFKMILMCNDLPKLAGNDGGIWRRIEVVNYISTFTDKPRPCEADPYQYFADEQLSAKLEQWKLLFMIQLLDKYRDYNKLPEDGGGTQPPPEVKEATGQYRSSNDIIANWMEDCVEESDDVTPFDELFSAWERWCDEEGYTNKQRPEKKEIKEYLKKAQEKTLAGPGIYGKKAAEGCPNGTKNKPKFNFTVIDD